MNKVLMYPQPTKFGGQESGIRRVVEAYAKYLPKYGWQITDDENSFDITAVHAGTAHVAPSVAHVHGLYWSQDHALEPWAWKANAQVIDGVRRAKQVTVPSKWVQEVFQRDMRFSPTVIPHGIDWWKHEPNYSGSYVLWNKNRNADVCDPSPVGVLASRAKSVRFLSTFSDANLSNLKITGVVDHAKMLDYLSNCSVYLATTKETFGIGILEAMAFGKPILGFAHGGILDMVIHEVNGYLAEPGNHDDLEQGLHYCLEHRERLGKNSADLVKKFTWDNSVKKLAEVYNACLVEEPATCDIIIPVFNKPPEVLARAIDSARSQSKYLGNVVVVNDGSEEGLGSEYEILCKRSGVNYISQENNGVAVARNRGIASSFSTSKYVCCLDADDALHEDFLLACVPELEADRGLGIAYTGIWAIDQDGGQGLSRWPGEFNYDDQLRRRNQVPTCCVFRRDMWERLGGYKQRYAPTGAGAEDAEFWLRAGAYGYGAKKVTNAGLFIYSLGGGHTSQKGYREVDWTYWHPWTKDDKHPFASMARPKRFSHPVRQYDQPAISVIIPVGPGHEEKIVDALDSLEAQTFRKWEVCVADDSHQGIPQWIKTAYPYMRIVETGGGKGAGYARNMAIKQSRAPLLLPLDADDFLAPTALEKMLDAWVRTGRGVYSDYYGISVVDDPAKLANNIMVISHDADTGIAVLGYKSSNFDCQKVMRQPENPPHIFANVTTMVPRRWHDEIGGFDESMPAWEDCLWLWQMVWKGHCFHRINEPLMSYRFLSGSRRNRGLEEWDNLIKYITIKKGEVNMGCGCSADESVKPISQIVQNNMAALRSQPKEKTMSDEEMVLVKYMHPNRGQHFVKGAATATNYGYREGGGQSVFLVHKNDIAMSPNIFVPIDQARPFTNEPAPKPVPEFNVEEYMSSIRNKWSGELDLQTLPGVTATVEKNMKASGFTTRDAILRAGAAGLQDAVKGLGQIKAEAIVAYLESVDVV